MTLMILSLQWYLFYISYVCIHIQEPVFWVRSLLLVFVRTTQIKKYFFLKLANLVYL